MRTALTDMLGLDEELSWLDAVTHGRPCIGPVNSRKDVNDGSAAQSGYRRDI
jgi:hypothetical protein